MTNWPTSQRLSWADFVQNRFWKWSRRNNGRNRFWKLALEDYSTTRLLIERFGKWSRSSTEWTVRVRFWKTVSAAIGLRGAPKWGFIDFIDTFSQLQYISSYLLHVCYVTTRECLSHQYILARTVKLLTFSLHYYNRSFHYWMNIENKINQNSILNRSNKILNCALTCNNEQ